MSFILDNVLYCHGFVRAYDQSIHPLMLVPFLMNFIGFSFALAVAVGHVDSRFEAGTR